MYFDKINNSVRIASLLVICNDISFANERSYEARKKKAKINLCSFLYSEICAHLKYLN